MSNQKKIKYKGLLLLSQPELFLLGYPPDVQERAWTEIEFTKIGKFCFFTVKGKEYCLRKKHFKILNKSIINH